MPENKPIATPLENEPLAEPIGDDAPGPRKDNAGGVVPQPQRGRRLAVRAGLPLVLFVMAAVPRLWQIGRESYWYDEVVTVEVARSAQVIATLKTMDASRAPLHPLLLHVWISWFGEGEGATRSLSALFGLVTVAVVFAIGWKIGGWSAGCWAMTFAALSPLLVQYDRETRMYSLLTMLTCLAWWNLLGFRDSASWVRCSLQSVLLALIAYAHPLGLLMIAGLGAGWLADWRRTQLGLGRWVAIHVVPALMLAPWIGNYLDHPPEFLSEARSLRFLIGMPIGFTGGNSGTMLVFAIPIALALVPVAIPKFARGSRGGGWPIVCWLFVAPVLLFVGSLIGPGLFGPSRYNVYVAPAYFVLIGVGLGSLRIGPSLALGGFLIVWTSLPSVTDLVQRRAKADWRSAAVWLTKNSPSSRVIVVSPDLVGDREAAVARFYVGDAVEPAPVNLAALNTQFRKEAQNMGPIFYSVSLRDGSPVGLLPRTLQENRVGDIRNRSRSRSRIIKHHDFSRNLRLIEVSSYKFEFGGFIMGMPSDEDDPFNF